MVNRFFDQQNYGGSLEYYIFELANYSFLVLLLSIFYKLRFINTNSLIVWSGIFFLPLFLNYFLFSPLLFPDQFQYAAELMSLKNDGISKWNIAAENSRFTIVENLLSIPTNPITFAVSLLGLAPIPNYMTVTSLAFANKFFLFFSFLALKNFFKNENILLLFFLIPSFLLYSSVSLRETLVILFGIFFLLNILRDNYLISFALILPLLIIKIQLFAFFAVYFIGRLIFRAHKNFYALIIYASFILIAAFIFEEIILQIVNYYRIGFAAEDMNLGDGFYGYYAFALYGDAESLTLQSMFELILVAIIGLPKILLMPLPNSWTNIFYPIQFLESIFLVSLYSWIAVKNNLLRNQEFIYLSFVLVLSLMLYSLLAFNEGTFVRYRFSLFLPFIFAIYYLATSNQVDSPKNNID
jgi:hypothetical protein